MQPTQQGSTRTSPQSYKSVEYVDMFPALHVQCVWSVWTCAGEE